MTAPKTIHDRLNELELRIDELGPNDEAERARLSMMLERLQRRIEHEDTDMHEEIVTELKEHAIEFETDHPQIAGVLRHIVRLLSGAGI